MKIPDYHGGLGDDDDDDDDYGQEVALPPWGSSLSLYSPLLNSPTVTGQILYKTSAKIQPIDAQIS